MKVLVVGGGGREHAIVWKLSQNKNISKIYCAPGNAGIGALAECVAIKVLEFDKIVEFAKTNGICTVIVGPDEPLAEGLVDVLECNGIRAFGPNKNAALIESSKIFAKDLMKKYNIPTAAYEVFENSENALEYLKSCKYPVVIKADGLALGKGVVIAVNYDDAMGAVIGMMEEGRLGVCGKKIVVEEFLQGVEVSVLAFTDGKTVVPMVSARDHKRAYDKDLGPNTGGMGTISPNPAYSAEIAQVCMRDIYIPTIEAMNKEGRPFKGVLFFGLMLTAAGPMALEYNARFGDPETQVVLPRLKTDLLEIIDAVIDEKLADVCMQWDERVAVCVVAASGGYPGGYETGVVIEGLQEANADDVYVFHAGTALAGEKLVTSGGRVLGVTALGDELKATVQKAYTAIGNICFKDMHYRKDIGNISGG